MNSRGQTIFTFTFWIIIFVLLLAGGLGYFITQMSSVAITNSGLSGIEGFILANFLLFILLGFIIAILWYASR